LTSRRAVANLPELSKCDVRERRSVKLRRPLILSLLVVALTAMPAGGGLEVAGELTDGAQGDLHAVVGVTQRVRDLPKARWRGRLSST
jgi:hypothetical protein